MNEAIRLYRDEYRDFVVWGRWANRSDEATIMRICGLTVQGSIPTWSMGIPDRTEDDSTPHLYRQDPPPDPSQALVTQDFMEVFQVTSPHLHRALVARHMRRVDGERLLIASESNIAQRLYEQPAKLAHPRLIHDCLKGYEAYQLFLKAMQACA